MKRVSVRRHISSNISQNRETFESSNGASTSSKTQIGAGFAKKTAKIRANAVKVCSQHHKQKHNDTKYHSHATLVIEIL